MKNTNNIAKNNKSDKCKYAFSLFKDRKRIKLSEKILSGSEELYIFENAASKLLAEGKNIELTDRIYEMMSSLLKKHEYLVNYSTIKNALLDAQTNYYLFNKELYCVNHCIALIILRSVPHLSDAQISNCAKTLTALEIGDYQSFFSEVSLSERCLMENEIYRNSDEDTRAIYRASVEEYAKDNGISEIEAAEKIGVSDYAANKSPTLKSLYFIIIALLTLSFFCAVAFISRGNLLLSVLLLVPIYQLSEQICILFFSRLPNANGIKGKIPKYKLDKIPDDAKTLVVITCVLSSQSEIDGLFEKAELYYLANRDDNAVFGILADLPDSSENISPKDNQLLDFAIEHVQNLNRKYKDKFCLFVRRRCYSKSEKKYIGWERKRGAILELVRKIKGIDGSFSDIVCNERFLSDVKYVVTLDSDTSLGLGKLKKLVGAMLHPSNKPVIKNGITVSGYGIMQPNISTSLLSENASDFSLMLCGGGGIDIYASSTFDVYQNLFGEGSFCGKGIFDVDSYYTLLDDAYREEIVLSHDLLEGARLRTAYLSDVSLSDSCPSAVLPYFKRLHRWSRGDVQSIAYAGNTVTDAKGRIRFNPISNLSKFKLYDNIIRIISPIIAVFDILLSGIWGTRSLSIAIAVSLLYLLFPAIVSVIYSSKNFERRFFSGIVPTVKRNFTMALFNIVSLFHCAFVSFDALVKALYRMIISKKNLLQWTTASEADKLPLGVAKYSIAFSDSIIAGLLLLIFYPYLSVKLLGILWALFPFWSLALSQKKPEKQRFPETKKAIINKYAYDMWKFYKEKANEEDNFLPPDNVRISPFESTAHRTSPTNIGLCLLSTLAARDFGFIKSDELSYRISATLKTINLLPKYCGHLYNWYDTESLEPLGKPYISTVDSGNFCACLIALKEGLYDYIGEDKGISELISTIGKILSDCDFSILYNKKRKLFCISYDIESKEQSENCYDILMSESRICSYYAIAIGAVPPEHWSKLSRTVISDEGFIGLASWSGTAFEYFMPSLLLPVCKNSLQYEALRFAFFEQSKAKRHNIYGKSESCFYEFDNDMNYQYKAHGVQSLGLAGGLAKEKVYSPYSTFLFLAVSKTSATENLNRMKDMGLYGKYGFYEAVDFTEDRVVKANSEHSVQYEKDNADLGEYSIIKSFMAHHIGMSIIASANACFNDIFVKRFMSNRQMQSAFELLTEKIPIDAPVLKRRKPIIFEKPTTEALLREKIEEINTEHNNGIVKAPLTSLISNGTLSVYCSSKGDILLKYKDTDVCGRDFCDIDEYGGIRLCFVADGKVYNATKSNYMMKSDNFSVKYKLVSNSVKAETDFCISANSNCLAVGFSVNGSFCEICPMLSFEPRLCKNNDFISHPAYNRLFVTSSFDKDENLLIFNYRGENKLCCAVGFANKTLDFEFLSRKSDYLPLMFSEKDFENLTKARFDSKTGACINPFCAIKKQSQTASGKYKTEFLIALGKNKEEAVSAIKSARAMRSQSLCNEFRKSMYSTVKYQMFASLLDKSSLKLSSLILTSILYEIGESDSADTVFGKNPLYIHGISDDLPIVSVRISEDILSDNLLSICSEFIKSHKYLRLKGTLFQLVFLCDESDSYSSNVSLRIKRLISDNREAKNIGERGGIFVIEADSDLFKYASCFYCQLRADTSIDSIIKENMKAPVSQINAITRISFDDENKNRTRQKARSKCEVISTKGGYFTPNGFVCEKDNKSYPWSYCYCGAMFGTVLTQNSLGFTYYENSREKRITKWKNDPYKEVCGERLLLHTEENIYDLCACSERVYFYRGCAIYSGVIENTEYKVSVGVDPKFYAKLINIELTNKGLQSAKLEINYETVYAMSANAPMHKLIVLRKYYGEEFAQNALESTDGRTAYKYNIGGLAHTIASYETVKCGFVFGVCRGESGADYMRIREKYRSTLDIEKGFYEYEEYYNNLISKVKIKTSSPSTDIFINYYAPYQIICDRLRARCGFYQPGGAYGFRDQLQDALSLLLIDTNFAKWQILRCCAHQYKEGDVMHWWHTVSGKSMGIRTGISDDVVWLAYALTEYIKASGDYGICKKQIYYIESPVLSENEKDRYEFAKKSDLRENVYFHCVKALDLALTKYGKHGLCLFGNGDWNDGMNNVGKGGESVWLSMFLTGVLKEFSNISEHFNDRQRAEKYRTHAETLLKNIEKHSFVNGQYIRGFYGDSKPLGSDDSEECMIDLIPQAFSAICGCDSNRTKSAFTKAVKILYDKENRLMMLLYPGFDGLSRSPGYIGNYPVGVRENGGEYCHAACFFAYALSLCKNADAAFSLLLDINPIFRYQNSNTARNYHGDPYSIPGDILSNESHAGRCGWNHYTGSAGWYYRIILGELIGIKRTKNGFTIEPCLPKDMGSSVIVKYCEKGTCYAISLQKGEKNKIYLDKKPYTGSFPFDGLEHFAEINIENK